MCGIVGYVGQPSGPGAAARGPATLEYRGYDSAGISVIAGDAIESVRAVGNLDNLHAAVAAGRRGVGGTSRRPRGRRRPASATRAGPRTGASTRSNAHPHSDTADRVHVVVNGIVENYLALKARLIDMGAVFTPETDAEVIAHLVAHHLATGTLVEAVRAAYAELEGHFAFVAMCSTSPDVLVGARKECPLVIGRGDGESSSPPPSPPSCARRAASSTSRTARSSSCAPRASRSCRPTGRRSSARSSRSTGTRRPPRRAASRPSCSRRSTSRPTRSPRRSPTARSAPTASTSTTRALDERSCATSSGSSSSPAARATTPASSAATRIEEWARLPVEMDIASEYRYRNPVVGPGDLVIGITQSGETADTLAAMRIARERGATVLAITNVMGSQATRDADGVLFTRAGLEVGVAATKTFVCQVAVMYLLALRLAELRGTLRAERRAESSPTSSASRTASRSCWTASTPGRRIADRPLATRTSSSTSAATSGCRSRSRAR